MKTLSSPHYSNNRRILYRVAAAVIDSRLLYGLEMTCLSSDALINSLAPIYNRYVRTISHLLPSTPADTTCVEAGLLPFRFRITVALCCKAATFAERTAGSFRTRLLEEADILLQKTADAVLPPVAKIQWYGERDWRGPKIRIDNRIKRNFRAGDNSVCLRRTVVELLETDYNSYQRRYTDGSLSTSGIGMGIFDHSLAVSMSLPEQCSIFSAEAAAILYAVTAPANRPIVVITDSASVVSALQSEAPRHPWIQDIITHVPPDLCLMWVPGHCGVAGNEAADQLAGAGPSGPRYKTAVPVPDIRRWVKALALQAWQDEWTRTRGHLRKIKQSTKAWTDLRSMREQTIISRLRTGHTRVTHNYGGSPFHRTCEICGIITSVEHIICVCPAYEGPRRLYDIPGSIRDALKDDPSSLAALICFIKDAGLFFKI